ncbi:MAG: hypothetical protein ABIP64_18755, partial [Burkholderiales bacterium]
MSGSQLKAPGFAGGYLLKAEDMIELDLDGNAVDLRGRKLYLERFILKNAVGPSIDAKLRG